ncbi:S-methyl-5-thioribose-1-phosphate isomerase [Candidatus Woesearchaeota archaeon]|nr:S-methyl-5-thioribose-1-phosphate isomerase [Candidatus Woesearchaeota archaeon]
MKINGKDYRTVWIKDGIVKMINQPLIPHKFEIVDLKNYIEVHDAIKTMIVRGAPAIGATAAYGVAQAVINFDGEDISKLKGQIKKASEKISHARPTAQDLFHGIKYVKSAVKSANSVEDARKKAKKAAKNYADESVLACKKIGEFGNNIIKQNDKILTHCNAGALATVDYGTALAPIRIAHYNKKKIFVFADETRPRSQGSRITAFELGQEGIDHAVIADNAAGYFMQKKEIDMVIVGADRVAVNGDVANKIGTYKLAVAAKENKIPFYVAIPLSTIDPESINGKQIPIEERSQEEVLYSYGWTDSGEFLRVRIAPEKSPSRNPAFDITPKKFVSGYITPEGIVNSEKLKYLIR